MAESESPPRNASSAKARQPGEPASHSDLGPSQLEELNDMFGIFDADKSGAIDPKEIRTQMRALGFEADNTTIYQLISDLDSDGSQKLEFTEFSGLLRDNLGIYTPEYTTTEGMQEVFDYMDDLVPGNRDGRIDASNLKRIAKVLGDNLSDAEIDVMINGADRNGKGHVTVDDFYALMAREAQRMIDEPRRLEREAKKATEAEVKGKWKKAARVMVSEYVEHFEEAPKEPKSIGSALKGVKKEQKHDKSEEKHDKTEEKKEAKPKQNAARKLVIADAEDDEEEEDEPSSSSASRRTSSAAHLVHGRKPGPAGRRSVVVGPLSEL
eukprot:TRINITY_DN2021_c0_g2_i1.p1 TRINITY_DN2021_c0_g2~~TRINITY_DN2021_c0_g2_i1.p1  ORF type:complete len:324 (+),score=77.98 TRINITY_DN2021_c0_g2_i1:37-1008(+)